jgi:hypothetical protein
MEPSRRATLAVVGTVGTSLLAGCSAGGGTGESGSNPTSSTSTPTPTPTTEPVDSFEVRLQNGETDRLLFDASDVSRVGEVTQQQGPYRVPVRLTAEATDDVAETFRAADVAAAPEEFTIVYRHDGETLDQFGISPELAASITDGEWDGRFQLVLAERADARELRRTLVDERE